MLNALITDFTASLPGATSTTRRLLIVSSTEAAAFIEQQLARTGYELRTATPHTTFAAIAQFSPGIVLVELPQGAEGSVAGLTLARRLRSEAATFALPLVLVFHKDDPATRRAALALGVDDYFTVTSSRGEMLARFDALLWRAAAGRRSASVAHDQQSEIDNFMLLLDHVRADIKHGRRGTLALVETLRTGATASAASLAKVYGFFKLHLRRVDAAAFYGPTTLFAYLPQTTPDRARRDLERLRQELYAEHSDADDARIAIGAASFPSDGIEIEDLIELAEARLASIEADAPETPRAIEQTTRFEDAASHVAPPAPIAPPVAFPSAAFAPITLTTNTAQTNVLLMPSVPPNGNGASNGNRHAKNGHAPIGVDDDVSETPIIEVAAVVEVAAKNGDAPAPKRIDTAVPSPHLNRDYEAFSPAAAEAAAKECELRARDVPMPRRMLLTVSDPARLAQLNSLVRSAGYQVRTAFAGQQALDLLRIERPDVLLLDYELCELDGVETLRRLHRQERGRSIVPTVMLFDAGHDAARQEALALGARAVITLPYQPAELLRCIRLAGTPE